jgi:hypothetical protein
MMCVIVALHKGNEISKERFNECWRSNQNGGGMMFAWNGQIYIHKELESKDALWDYYQAALELTKREVNILLHFRITTHGPSNLHNCHPHLVHENLAFMHNGIISIPIAKNSLDSDTVTFNKDILQKLPPDFLRYQGCQELISDYCSGSKLAFLDNEGSVKLINSEMGIWEDEGWYSNDSYLSYQWSSRSKGKNTSYSWDNWESDEASTTYISSPYSNNLTQVDQSGFINEWGESVEYCSDCNKTILVSDIEEELGMCEACISQYEWSSDLNSLYENSSANEELEAKSIHELSDEEVEILHG